MEPKQTSQAALIRNVVIVHGALADGSGWRKVHDILTAKGYVQHSYSEQLIELIRTELGRT